MNYIEANIIISQIVDAYASKYNDSLFGVPQSKLPFYSENWKADLTIAASLFVSHTILWNNYDKDWIEMMFSVLSSFTISPDKYILDGKEALNTLEKAKSAFYSKTHKRKIDEAKSFMSNVQMPSFNITPITNTYNHMADFYNQITYPNYEKGVPIETVVHNYVVEVYKVIGLPHKEEYDYYFYTFDQARRWLKKPKMREYFLPYENHLLTHKK